MAGSSTGPRARPGGSAAGWPPTKHHSGSAAGHVGDAASSPARACSPPCSFEQVLSTTRSVFNAAPPGNGVRHARNQVYVPARLEEALGPESLGSGDVGSAASASTAPPSPRRAMAGRRSPWGPELPATSEHRPQLRLLDHGVDEPSPPASSMSRSRRSMTDDVTAHERSRSSRGRPSAGTSRHGFDVAQRLPVEVLGLQQHGEHVAALVEVFARRRS